MIHALLFSIAVSTSAPASLPRSVVTAPSDPPVHVSLNSDGRYVPGDRARVHIQTAEDGYLVVLRTDVDGWVRVLYPASPTDDDFVHAGRSFEIRGRDNREAFQAGHATGSGTIIAAWSHEAFHFDRFVRNDHWDYRALDSMRTDDAESGLVDIVQQMAGDVHFDYDVAPYSVGDRGYANHAGYYGGYGPYAYDPFFYPYGYYPVDYGFGFGVGFGFGYGFGGRGCFRLCYSGYGGFGPFRPYGYPRGFGFGVGFGRPSWRPGVFNSGVAYRNRSEFGARAFSTVTASRLGVRASAANNGFDRGLTRTGQTGARSYNPQARPEERRVSTGTPADHAPAARGGNDGSGRSAAPSESRGGGGRSSGGGGHSSGGGRSGGGRSGGGGRRSR